MSVAVASFGVVISHGGGEWGSTTRSRIDDMLAPVAALLARPVNAVKEAGIKIGDSLHLRAEPAEVKAVRNELAQWQAAAKALEAENKSLRNLMQVVPAGSAQYIAARMVSDSASPYMHAALISAGSEDGIRKDQAVISAAGLLGRVTDAGKSSARVLLLTDVNSRIPVIGEISRERSILAGDNTASLSLNYAASHTSMKVGERIVTSGDGGVFPVGIPVAVVTRVENGVIHASPLADWQESDYVSVVNYTF